MIKQNKIYPVVPGYGTFTIERGRACCVMIHGGLTSPHYYREFAEYLAGRGFSIVAPVLAGHGRNYKALPGTTWQEILDSALEGLLSAASEGYSPIFLIGHSLGGCLSLALAIEHPELVDGLTTISSPANHPSWMIAATRLGAGLVLKRSFEGAGGDYEENRALYDRYTRIPVSFFHTIMSGFSAYSDRLNEVHAPILVVHGRKDDWVPLSNAKKIYHSTNSRPKYLWIIREEGHGPLWYENRHAVFERIANTIGKMAEVKDVLF